MCIMSIVMERHPETGRISLTHVGFHFVILGLGHNNITVILQSSLTH